MSQTPDAIDNLLEEWVNGKRTHVCNILQQAIPSDVVEFCRRACRRLGENDLIKLRDLLRQFKS